MIATNSPDLMLPFIAFETIPTTVGPTEQPRSPASANIANIAVPPLGHSSAARLNAPVHKTPTAKPHSPHPIR